MPNAISMPNAIFIASAIVFAQYQPPQTRKSDHTKKTVYSGVQGKLIFITGGKTGSTTTIYSHLTQSIQYRLMRY